MTPEPASSKMTTGHQKRDAYLYIRQSTIRQIVKNTESTQRQYALRQRAVALGWPLDRIMVIDRDKRMVRLLVQDITLVKGGEITTHVRFNDKNEVLYIAISCYLV